MSLAFLSCHKWRSEERDGWDNEVGSLACKTIALTPPFIFQGCRLEGMPLSQFSLYQDTSKSGLTVPIASSSLTDICVIPISKCVYVLTFWRVINQRSRFCFPSIISLSSAEKIHPLYHFTWEYPKAFALEFWGDWSSNPVDNIHMFLGPFVQTGFIFPQSCCFSWFFPVSNWLYGPFG